MAKKLETEQIVAIALLLNFKNISSLDLYLLTEDFIKENPDFSFNESKLENLSKYVISENAKISLKDGLTLDSYLYGEKITLKERLEKISGPLIIEHFENYDLEEFVLRKLKRCFKISENLINRYFCEVQSEALKKLNEKGYITTFWSDETIYDDHKEIKLSNTGNLRLFKIDNAKEIERFTEELQSLRYDTNLLDDYLMTQDLDLPVWNVLDIGKIDEFCNNYDRFNLEPGVSSLHYEKLEYKKGRGFDENSKKLMENMLSVWDDGHCIYICHPNHIFGGAKLLTRDVRKIENVNWDDIDVEKMFRINDYKCFLGIHKAFKYAHRRLGHQIMNEMQIGNKDTAVSYLAVVERYVLDHKDHYLIRGFIKGDYEGYSVAFNPEYQKLLPQSTWEKQLRLGGNEIPSIYSLPRNK